MASVRPLGAAVIAALTVAATWPAASSVTPHPAAGHVATRPSGAADDADRLVPFWHDGEDRADGAAAARRSRSAAEFAGAAGALPAASPAADVAPQVADPARIRIPAIGVDAAVVALGLTTERALEVPEDFDQTGWWTGGPEPGETGPAVIVGHVDSYEGPAVFARLHELRPGDRILIDRVDGSLVTFAVTAATAVTKDAFPTDVVYGSVPDARLRLITCHGDFTDGSYLGNYIVLARQVAERDAR